MSRQLYGGPLDGEMTDHTEDVVTFSVDGRDARYLLSGDGALYSYDESEQK